jgi:Arc/MetJ family transcription regulator
MRSTTKKKTYNLNEDLIERARRILDAKTETEAIRKALEKAIENRQVEESLDRLLRKGRFRTVYR